MAVRTWLPTDRRLAFGAGEFAGALGDSVTVLPLVVALGAVTPAPLPQILLWFGAFQVVWGLWYGLPLSVEPMKALLALAVAGSLAYGELLAAGLLAAVALLALGSLGVLERVQSLVGRPVVRGVQLAVALLLARAGLRLAAGDLRFALAGVALAVGVAAVGRARLAALVVLTAGTLWALLAGGLPVPTVPVPAVFPAGRPTLSGTAVSGTLAQLAMTVGNAAVATSLLLGDLFDADVSPDRLARSMGAMDVVAIPLGGLPMCHGSGGLAGKYAFGARTGGANVLLGLLYVGAAAVAGVWSAFPMATLGVLLVVVAAQLGRVAVDSDGLPVTVAVGVLAVLTTVGVAFLVGAAYWLARQRLPVDFPFWGPSGRS
ncbi:MAG: putative sulfate/molybdate transporter [Haloarculaceae archaeon]